jgi:hypothetical protein
MWGHGTCNYLYSVTQSETYAIYSDVLKITGIWNNEPKLRSAIGETEPMLSERNKFTLRADANIFNTGPYPIYIQY